MTNVHHRLKSIQTDLLDDIKKENDELRSRVNELQSSIESGEKEILTVSIKLSISRGTESQVGLSRRSLKAKPMNIEPKPR